VKRKSKRKYGGRVRQGGQTKKERKKKVELGRESIATGGGTAPEGSTEKWTSQSHIKSGVKESPRCLEAGKRTIDEKARTCIQRKEEIWEGGEQQLQEIPRATKRNQKKKEKKFVFKTVENRSERKTTC